MTGSGPDPMSRRELLGGRFIGKLLGHAADQIAARVDPGGSDLNALDAPHPTAHASAHVMRYPRTSDDVTSSSLHARQPSARTRQRRQSIPVLRPPGAVAEEKFLNDCTRCDACMTACEPGAIIPAPARFRQAAGTPMIDADAQPCMMCNGFPCIAACEPGVLTHHVPKAMGTARITEETCLAHYGTTCTVCSEHCPVEGAIEVIDGKPRIVEESCTGCGVCRYVCPAPENAVLHMPTFVRPAPSP